MSTAIAPVELPPAAFLFADVVAFTAYTEARGDAAAAQLAWRLRLGVEQQLGADAHVVKSLGDAVMVRIADAVDAAAAGVRIASRALPAPGDPQVRVGIHYGSAVECDGDFFGTAVNVAARVAALARPGEVLITDALACAARGHRLRRRGVALETVGERALRNVAQPVLIHGALASERQCEPRARIREPRAIAGRTELAHA
jgi:class 3 adenylate cyclase